MYPCEWWAQNLKTSDTKHFILAWMSSHIPAIPGLQPVKQQTVPGTTRQRNKPKSGLSQLRASTKSTEHGHHTLGGTHTVSSVRRTPPRAKEVANNPPMEPVLASATSPLPGLPDPFVLCKVSLHAMSQRGKQRKTTLHGPGPASLQSAKHQRAPVPVHGPNGSALAR